MHEKFLKYTRQKMIPNKNKPIILYIFSTSKDDEIEKFYIDLANANKECGSKDINMLLLSTHSHDPC